MNKGKALLTIFLFSIISIGFSGCQESAYKVAMVKPKKGYFPTMPARTGKRKGQKLLSIRL